MAEDIKNNQMDDKEKRFEIMCGIVIAIFASILVISQLMGDNNNEERTKAQAKANNMYAWFNAKGIKQNLVEGERDLLLTLIESGVISPDKIKSLKTRIEKLEKTINRYKKEKTEILLGSKKVGKENWAQDLDGEMGKIIGAKEWDKRIEITEEVDNLFDFATLFLQVSLIIGAVALIMKNPKMKWTFFIMMVILSSIGIYYTIIAASKGTAF